jgi:transcriptional regulator with XRE-family HTH domain
MNFASKNLKFLITELNVSQISLEPVVNKKQQTISNWVNGKYEPEAEDLVRLSDWFGITIDDFCLIDLSEGNLISQEYIAKFKKHGNLKGNQTGNLKREIHKINGDQDGEDLTRLGGQEGFWILMKLLQQMDAKLDQIRVSVEKGQKK